MTFPNYAHNEYMDTGALTPDAVPEPPTEAEESDSTVDRAISVDVPEGVEIFPTPEDAEPKIEVGEGSEADLPEGATLD